MRALSPLALLAAVLPGCRSAGPPIPTAPRVDLPRFMGDWFVIANLPTFLEEGAHNAVESYAMNADGTIATTFRFRDGSFDGPEKQYTATGFVADDGSGAVWGMQFVWPVKAEYLVAYVSPDYSETVIARNARDYVWIMARDPKLPDADYERLLKLVGELGYDTSRVQRVPQRW